MKMKKVLVGIAATSIALSLAACSGGGGGGRGGSAGGTEDNKGALVGVAMPTKTSERWVDDGNNVNDQLTKLGYKVDLQYANDKVQDQISQIETMLNKGAKALIVASIDGTALTQVLKTAADDGVKVIAYDRLINGTEDVDYYTTFDNQQVGVLQGNSLLQGLGLVDADGKATGSTEKKTIEVFAGSPDDNNAQFFYDGAMSVLKPFLDSGQVTIGSGQSDFSQVAIQQWKQEGAQARMENLLSGSYPGGAKPDGVLSPYDGLSRGIIQALTSAGVARTPCRSSRARTARRRPTSSSSTASSTRRSSRTRACSARRPSRWSTTCSPAARPTLLTPTTTRSRTSRPSSSPP